MFQGGYFTIGRWRGAPVRLHWTLPLGALAFGRFEIRPAFWFGFFLLIFLHEMGHAVVVDRCRQRVHSIDIHGLGGMCRWSGAVTDMQRAMIAWGGVWAQIALLAATQAAIVLLGPPATTFTQELASALIATNLLIMAINLIPVPPLDGAEAWRIVPLLRRRALQARAARRRQRELADRRRRMAALHVVRRDDADDAEDAPLTPEVKAVVDEVLDRIDPRRNGKG